MSATASQLLLIIEERRHALTSEAHSLISAWFDNDTQFQHKRRFYSPHVKEMNGDSVSIHWTRRFPVNNWQGKIVTVRGKRRMVKVTVTHVPARKTGPAYPITAFPAAPDDELADIIAMEETLSPIRLELAFLGKLRRQISSYYKTDSETDLEADHGQDDLVFARATIGGKATW